MNKFCGRHTSYSDENTINQVKELIDCDDLDELQELAGEMIEIIKRLDDKCRDLDDEILDLLNWRQGNE